MLAPAAQALLEPIWFLVTEYEYGAGGCTGCGGNNGLLTAIEQHVDDSTSRRTELFYDWRSRLAYQIDPADAGGDCHYTHYTYDSLGQVTQTDRYCDTDADGPESSSAINASTADSADKLIGRTKTYYDDLGQVWKTERYDVYISDVEFSDDSDSDIDIPAGTVADCLVAYNWYDAAGNTIKTREGGTELFTKNVYDSLGRLTTQYKSYDTTETPGTHAEASGTTNDILIEQTDYTYDDAGNMIWKVWARKNGQSTINRVMYTDSGTIRSVVRSLQPTTVITIRPRPVRARSQREATRFWSPRPNTMMRGLPILHSTRRERKIGQSLTARAGRSKLSRITIPVIRPTTKT